MFFFFFFVFAVFIATDTCSLLAEMRWVTATSTITHCSSWNLASANHVAKPRNWNVIKIAKNNILKGQTSASLRSEQVILRCCHCESSWPSHVSCSWNALKNLGNTGHGKEIWWEQSWQGKLWARAKNNNKNPTISSMDWFLDMFSLILRWLFSNLTASCLCPPLTSLQLSIPGWMNRVSG